MSEANKSGLTPISSLGEFGLIDRITRNFPQLDSRLVRGIGDDAAVLAQEQGKVSLHSTDMLLEGVHFDLSYAPLRHLGYKAVAVNISDIAAMNARPVGLLVSLGLSSRFPVEAVEELYEGIKLACENYGLILLGGDTCSSRQGLVISVTALGEADPDEVVYRSGAEAGDLICVSGDLGAAYAGFLVLDREKQVYMDKPHEQPDLSDYDYVVGRQLKPEPRFDILEKLKKNGLKPTSMMDISDGVASELIHLSKNSQKGVKIFANKLPIDYQTISVADEFKIGPQTFALNGGEDYELIFTLPVGSFEKLRAIPEISIIGHMTDDPSQIEVVLEDGSVTELIAQGWEHFK